MRAGRGIIAVVSIAVASCAQGDGGGAGPTLEATATWQETYRDGCTVHDLEIVFEGYGRIVARAGAETFEATDTNSITIPGDRIEGAATVALTYFDYGGDSKPDGARELPLTPRPIAMKIRASTPSGTDHWNGRSELGVQRGQVTKSGTIEFRFDVCNVASASGPGATVEIEGNQMVIAFDARDRFLAATENEKLALSFPVTAVGRDGSTKAFTLEGTAPVVFFIRKAYADVATEPIAWAPPYNKGKSPHPTLALGLGGHNELMYGKPFRDIELVATAKTTAVESGRCGPYDPGDKYFVNSRTDTAVEVREARTGKLVAEKSFTGPKPECAANILVRDGKGSNTGSMGAAPEAWVKRLSR